MIEPTPSGVILTIRVVPGAARPGPAGMRGGAILIRLTAPPVEGAANAELVEVVAAALGVPRRSVSIVGGERSRLKRVRVDGITPEDAREKLGA